MRLPREPRALVFVDAVVPPPVGHHKAPSELRQFLDDLAEEGTLPRWSTWWGENTMAELIPDTDVRTALESEQPRVPLSFYDEAVPVPDGWAHQPCGYVRLSPAYDSELEEATARGWITASLDRSHLATVTHPGEVLNAIEVVLDHL